MKNLKTLSLIIVALFAFSYVSNAQNWKDLKKKAKDKSSKIIKDTKNDTGKNTSSDSDNSSKTTNSSGTDNSTSSGNISSSSSSVNTNNQDENQTDDVVSDTDYPNYIRKKSNLTTHLILSSSAKSSRPFWTDYYTDEYYKNAKDMNYVKVYPKIKEKGKADASGYHYEIVLKFKKEYQTFFDGYIATELNQIIEEAYKVKDFNKKQSLDHLKRAVKVMDAVMLNIPDYQSVKDLKTDIDKSITDIGGDYFKKVFTSDFHKQNAGKILFSNKPIVAGKEDPAQFKTEFTINENIYAIAYLDGTITDITGNDPKGRYVLNIDNSTNKYINFGHNPQDMQMSYYPIEIIPAVDIAIHGLDCIEFAKALTSLSPRNHTIKLSLGYGFSQVMAEGEFKIDLAGMDAVKLKADSETASNNAQNNYAKNTKLPEDFLKVTQKFSDPKLSQAAMKIILKKNWTNCAQLMKVIVMGNGTAEDWMIYKNSIDIPKYKSTRINVGAIYKGKDGWCYYVTDITFTSDYLGGGKYSAVKLYGTEKHVKIDCKNCK
ncbi:MAG: hypothetical protein K8R54_19310 [Bacteroidales bacterium]|nr:hypothetical protein [Bacteroidales bacterium]